VRGQQRSLRTHVGRRDALLDLLRAVNATLDPRQIADIVIDRATTWILMPGWVVVSADASGCLSLLAERGLTPEMRSVAPDIARWMLSHGEEFVAADLRHDARIPAARIGSVVAFPLRSRERGVGALVGLDTAVSQRAPRLAPSHLQAVRVLLETAATALDNALLLERAETLSVTDDLTRLYNSRYLKRSLERETQRRARSGRPLSLLFIDLDDFKRVNDDHGHLCGSRALVEVAAVLKGTARGTDVVARYGGDEFALILPDTGRDGARVVGERVRRALAEHRFLADEGLDVRLTASVGIATLPDAARSADQLIQAADSAMYRVKDSGKNGIFVAESADTNHSSD
jgi:diguanylate cyclase (GGDEF)-like protein